MSFVILGASLIILITLVTLITVITTLNDCNYLMLLQESPRGGVGAVDEGSSLLDDAERAAAGTDDLLPASNGNSPGMRLRTPWSPHAAPVQDLLASCLVRGKNSQTQRGHSPTKTTGVGLAGKTVHASINDQHCRFLPFMRVSVSKPEVCSQTHCLAGQVVPNIYSHKYTFPVHRIRCVVSNIFNWNKVYDEGTSSWSECCVACGRWASPSPCVSPSGSSSGSAGLR
jgi:hypothetical protein